MKKILSLLVMAIFLISLVPAALAAGNGNGNSAEPTKYQVGGEREEFISQAEQKRQELKEKRVKAITGRTRERVEVATKRMGLLRKFQENKQDLRQVVQKAVQRREQAIENYKKSRQKIEQMKNKLQQCKGKTKIDCTEARKQARKHSQDFLFNAADRALALVEKTRERIENSDMSEEDKADALADLEERAAEIASARETIDAIGENPSKDEIKEATKVLRESWTKANKEIKQKAAKNAAGKIGGTLVKIERLNAKLERTVEQLKSRGLDTTPIETMMQQFENKIQEAKDKHAEAEQKFSQGKANEAAQKIREAHSKVKEAHMLLKDVVRKIRKANQGQEIREGLEPETKAEEEAEEAAEEAAEAAEAAEEAAEEEAEEAEEEAEEEQEETAEIEDSDDSEEETEEEQEEETAE
ncbi:hypothetical protein GF358_01260 [Candidatus Woesearchaeota archaeon]|nr:hypothetical protein [Candidatus Woesearchaeota archaeon]